MITKHVRIAAVARFSCMTFLYFKNMTWIAYKNIQFAAPVTKTKRNPSTIFHQTIPVMSSSCNIPTIGLNRVPTTGLLVRGLVRFLSYGLINFLSGSWYGLDERKLWIFLHIPLYCFIPMKILMFDSFIILNYQFILTFV